MKKLLITIALVLFIGCGIVSAKDPEYEVTINIVYNSIPIHEIVDILKDQLREHKDACKVEVKIKNVTDNGTTTIFVSPGTTWTTDDTVTSTWTTE